MIFTFSPLKKNAKSTEMDFCRITVCTYRGSSLFFFLRRTLVLNKATVSRGFKFLLVYKPSPASINDF